MSGLFQSDNDDTKSQSDSCQLFDKKKMDMCNRTNATTKKTKLLVSTEEHVMREDICARRNEEDIIPHVE